MYHRAAAEVCPHMQQALPLVEEQWHVFHVKLEFRQLWSGGHGQGDLLIGSMVHFCTVLLAPTP